jgi:hypothetical protein
MARQPAWTEEEWILLLDVFHLTREHPSDEDVERLRQDLVSLAMRSEDPRIREAVDDPHFRTHRSIS